MQKSIIRKGLVCLVIILLIGIGINSAFAVDISNSNPSDKIEDCECTVIDNYDIVKVKSLLNRAEGSLNRVEIYTKLITNFSKDNPKVLEDCEELSEKITIYREMIVEELSDQNSFYSSQSNGKLCNKLVTLIVSLFDSMENIVDISEKIRPDSILHHLLVFVFFTYVILTTPLVILYLCFCFTPYPVI